MARLASAGARARSMAKNTQTPSCPQKKAEPTSASRFIFRKGLGSTAEVGGGKAADPRTSWRTCTLAALTPCRREVMAGPSAPIDLTGDDDQPVKSHKRKATTQHQPWQLMLSMLDPEAKETVEDAINDEQHVNPIDSDDGDDGDDDDDDGDDESFAVDEDADAAKEQENKKLCDKVAEKVEKEEKDKRKEEVEMEVAQQVAAREDKQECSKCEFINDAELLLCDGPRCENACHTFCCGLEEVRRFHSTRWMLTTLPSDNSWRVAGPQREVVLRGVRCGCPVIPDNPIAMR